MDRAPAISTSELTKRYGSVVAVDNLTLEVNSGELFGFLGPNGAGKTTTMRMLLGLVRPSAGSASMLGMDVSTQLAQVLERTGSIIENPTFYPYLSGYENLRLVARLRQVPDSEINPILETVDLSNAAKRKFRKYSLGMKQRLAVGAALLGNPDLLILDEPANGLDPAGIVEMRTLMRRLKSEGHTVFISSHVLHEIEQVCDRIAILNRGKIVVQGKVESLLRGGERVELVVAQQAEAINILKRVDWVGPIDLEEHRLTISAPFERSAEINQILADQGIYASEIRPREESLEQYFLDVTSTPGDLS